MSTSSSARRRDEPGPLATGVPNAPAVRRALLDWFDRSKRDLPWRGVRDPYPIWLSEIMLQQTQVVTVIPYFLRFLERFPTVEALASAPLTDVLAMWRGLGYYSRARNLHAAAQRFASEGFPRTAKALRTFPGLGRYTSAAVASIAFGEPVAVLDGNVARVLSRLLAIEGPTGDRANEKRLWNEAEALLDRDRPGDFNQALMELGATVCKPVNPSCLVCPVASSCEARRLGRQAEIPAPKIRPARKQLRLACAVIRSRDGLLLARREESGLFGGLWELPSAELGSEESGPEALWRALGIEVVADEPLASVRRILTHRELSLSLFEGRPVRRRLPGYREQRRVRDEELDALGMSTAMVAALKAWRRRAG